MFLLSDHGRHRSSRCVVSQSLLRISSAFLVVCGLQIRASNAHADSSLATFLEQGNPLIDIRGRYEGVDDASKPVEAHAYTLRARLGYQTAPWMGLTALAEMDQVWAPGSAFNSTRNGKTSYPVVADPAMTALNRLQVAYASEFSTQFIVGRQRILLADQRFVGNAAWRQHEQTYDAASLMSTIIPGFALSYSYVDRVNRVYGPEKPSPATGPAGAFHCDCHLIDVTYTDIPQLKLEAFGFLLALDQRSGPSPSRLAAEKLSTATLGARGEYQAKLWDGAIAGIIGTYAHQSDYRNNPLALDLNYLRGEVSVSYVGLTGTIGYEGMEGNGQAGFSTPLATTHLFDGWADMFLATPANGLGNLYVKASYAAASAASFLHIASLTATVVHRDFSTDRTNGVVRAGLGTEWDGALEFGIDKHTSILLQYADYRGSGLTYGGFRDKSIGWVQLGYRY